MKKSTRLASFFIALSYFISGCGGREEKVSPIRKDIIQAVYASGKIYPIDYYKVNVNIPGYMKEILVKVGDTVKVGQALFTMKNEISSFYVSTARNNLELALLNASENSAYFSNYKQELSAAKTKLEADSAAYFRLKNQGDESNQGQIEKAQNAYESQKLNFRKAQKNYNSAKAKMETDLKNAKNLYQAQSSNSDFTYSSTITGRVYDIMGKQGEYLTPQISVMEIGRIDEYEVELSIDEADINYIAKGQSVVYQTEAYPNLYLKGIVKQVFPKISTLNKSIKVIASIDLPKGIMLYAGATLEANIINSKRKNALVIPRYYLHTDSVIVKREGKKQKVKVELGVGNVEYIEVLSGIKEDEKVYKL